MKAAFLRFVYLYIDLCLGVDSGFAAHADALSLLCAVERTAAAVDFPVSRYILFGWRYSKWRG